MQDKRKHLGGLDFLLAPSKSIQTVKEVQQENDTSQAESNNQSSDIQKVMNPESTVTDSNNN